MKTLLNLCLVVIFGCLVACQDQTDDDAAHGQWEMIFNGSDFTGWEQRGGVADFIIEDSAIVGITKENTPSSFLCTEEDYEDFLLELDVKMDTAMNSGIQFRSFSRPDYQNGKVHGYQVELDASDIASPGGIFNQSRGGWAQKLEEGAPAREAFKAMEWNTIKVEANGERIRTWVNGVPAADFIDTLDNRHGMICLQVHSVVPNRWPAGKRIAFKNIRLKELE